MKTRTSKVISRFGQWVVTTHGLECLTQPYPIRKKRLLELDWVEHMRAKTWCDIVAFSMALEAARRYHYPKSQ